MNIFILLLFLSVSLIAKDRKWWNADKTKSFIGKATKINDNEVKFIKQGKIFKVPLTKLSQQDQEWIKKHLVKSETRWDFNTLKGWLDGSQNNSPPLYKIKQGKLAISTRGNTKDRVKVKRRKTFGAGRYAWRVYVPKMEMHSRASIGAFIYSDDTREIDFEIGSGTATLRKKLQAKPNDVVCYLTSQGHPFTSDQILLKEKTWYTLEIELRANDFGNYDLTWLIDGKILKKQLSKISTKTTFSFFLKESVV